MGKFAVHRFPPAYFTLVMATGIISLAAHAQHISWLAESFFYVNLGLYPLFLLLLAGRLVSSFSDVKAELAAPEKGPIYLALVAATCLVGSQFVLLRGNLAVGQGLWVLGAVCWVALLYGLLLGVTLRQDKPPVEKALNASWLLLVVSTQALAVLGASLLPSLPGSATETGRLVVISLFLLGSFLYLTISTLLLYRLVFLPMEAQAVEAPYWISVGGSAITVMAGGTLLGALPPSLALADTAGFVKGWSVLFWAVSTWWLPFVAVLRLRYHLRATPTFPYQPTNWSMVFPLGMYAACTGRLAEALLLPVLKPLAASFLWVALLAWALTGAGMVVHFFSATKQPAAAGQ